MYTVLMTEPPNRTEPDGRGPSPFVEHSQPLNKAPIRLVFVIDTLGENGVLVRTTYTEQPILFAKSRRPASGSTTQAPHMS